MSGLKNVAALVIKHNAKPINGRIADTFDDPGEMLHAPINSLQSYHDGM